MTKLYAMTGGATGIGASLKEKLRERGDTVIVVDLKDADIDADLSTAEGRQAAIDGIRERAPEGLDGFIPCAGLPPVATPFSLIDKVNFFGTTVLVEALSDLLAKKQGAIVAVSSNSAPLPGLNEQHIETLLGGDEAKACELIETLDGHNAYAGSKNALARWVRRKAPILMEQGVRMNAVAPGMTVTPLTDRVLDDENFGSAMRDFSKTIPFGEMASPDMIADTMLFLLDPAARFVCGSILFVDGGQDALLRADQFYLRRTLMTVSEHAIENQLDLPPIDQIGFVVPDMDKALALYEPLFGKFRMMESPVEGALLHGEPADCDLTLAFANSGDLEIELIAVNSGKSPHQEFLDAGGNGMHHIRYRVEDHDSKVAAAEAAGYRTIWQHRLGDSIAWSYMQKDGDPLVIEFLQMP